MARIAGPLAGCTLLLAVAAWPAPVKSPGTGPAPSAAGATASAANPRITASVENADLRKAVAALRNASGIDVRVVATPRPDPGAGADPPKKSFRWTATPFGDALRQICTAFQVYCRRDPVEYRISPFPGFGDPLPPPAADAPVCRKDGVIVRSLGAGWGAHGPRFPRPGATGKRTPLAVGLQFELGSVDAARLASLANVVAQDDRGNLITYEEPWPPMPPSRRQADASPDRWTTELSFPDPDSRTRKLVWLQGDLMVYRNPLILRLEIPFSAEAKVSKARFAGWDVEIECSGHAAVSPPRLDRPRRAEPERDDGPSVKIRLVGQGDNRLRNGLQHSCELLGESGLVYPAQGRSSRGDVQTLTLDNSFASIEEPITKVIVEFLLQEETTKLQTFRLANIPVPAALPVRADKESIPAAPPEPPRGTLDFPVRFAGGTLPPGSVSLGLSRKEAAGWAPIRWQEASLDEKGIAHLSDLAPGTYRIIRRFRAQKPLPTGGHWIGETVTATLSAGKPTTLPPLRWVPSR